MKKINIVNIQLPNTDSVYISQKNYSVGIGNGKLIEFKSLKAAKCFVAETNRFLNDILIQTNYLYIYCFTEYRKNWVFFSARISKVYMKLLSIERGILDAVRDIEHHFNLVVTRSHYPNGNHFTWSHLTKIIQQNLFILKLLEEFNQEKNNFTNKEIILYKHMAQNLLKQLKNYPEIS